MAEGQFLQSSLLQRFPQFPLRYQCLEAFFLFYVNPFYPFRSYRVWSQKWSHSFQGERGALFTKGVGFSCEKWMPNQ